MSGASVLFYGRRSRPSRSFDDLGFGSSAAPSLSSSSSDPSSSSSHRHRHRKSDLHRRNRHSNADYADSCRQSSNFLHPCSRSSVAESEPHQRVCIGGSSSQDVNNRETVNGLSRRYCRNDRLPGSVLLAKERLLQRLRGVSVSETRHSREASLIAHCNNFGVVDADWETIVSGEQPAANTILTELPVGANQQSSPRDPKNKPLGFTKETLSQLQHEVFLDHQNDVSHLMSEASNECCICLENFAKGNKLVNLPCGHRFHTSCLYPWLQTCGVCPYCRACIVLT